MFIEDVDYQKDIFMMIIKVNEIDIDTANRITLKKQKQKQFLQCSFSNCNFNLN